MAFGFGFNKAKVLASAEKSVKQGKLQNAIADYEKVAKEDPKDLTVLNTIGDLYARVGNSEQATVYFKRVGDAYASDGFTVKAIAMYKKLTKQNPNATDAILKLGELYTQQGLYNDARAQYMQVADSYLRNNELDKAAAIFQRMLELDPDNMTMQSRVAELYVRLNKKAEARDLYFRSAQALHAKGALDACDDALEHVISLDPGFSQAILLRGQVRLQAEDAESAIQYLEMLPDIDSRPDALRMLMQAYLQQGKSTEAEPIARKILNVFNDPTGITTLAEGMMASGAYENALRLYREHSDRLLAANAPAVLEALHACISRVKDNSRALEILRELFSKAGDTTHLAEVTELAAHAYVQEGALTSARDLYQKLAELEPQNPLHAQNYKQIMAKLGQDAVGRPLTAEEGAQAFMVDELEPTVRVVEQLYPAELTEAIRAALTDSELFDSYNLPARAVPPLEAVLPSAPRDVQLNQRLASLYARVGRLADAAERCRTLESVYSEAGHGKEARDYADMATRYRERSGLGPQTAAAEAEPAPPPQRALVLDLPGSAASAPPAVQPAASLPGEFGPEAGEEQPFGADAFSDFKPAPPSTLPSRATVAPAPYPTAAAAAQFQPAPRPVPPVPPVAAAPLGTELELEVTSQASGRPVSAPQPAVTEFHFGSQAASPFPDFDVEPPPAMAASTTAVTPELQPSAPPAVPSVPEPEHVGAHEIDLSEEWDRMLATEPVAATAAPSSVPSGDGSSAAAMPEEPAAAEPSVVSDLIEEIRFYLSQSMWEEARGALARAESVAPGLAALRELRGQLAAGESARPSPAVSIQDDTAAPVLEPQISSATTVDTPEGASVAEFVFDESALGENVAPTAAQPKPPVKVAEFPIAPAAATQPALDASAQTTAEIVSATPVEVTASGTPENAPAALDAAAAADAAVSPEAIAAAHEFAELPNAVPTREDMLGGFVLDLEESLGDDFLVEPPSGDVAAPAEPPAVAETATASAMPAGAASVAPAISPAPPPQPPVAPAVPPAASAPAAAMAAAGMPEGQAEAGPASALSDIFAEFKEDMEAGSESGEDPETHYNLGVAFKEMGLLDEAIGELQKVCQGVEHGQPFSQVIEAYTWLADCFVQKGVPEAGIRWYEKSLAAPGIDDVRATAIHYELACAHEAAGDRTAALKHFMEVYGTNIDYRDVAERIKSLKS